MEVTSEFLAGLKAMLEADEVELKKTYGANYSEVGMEERHAAIIAFAKAHRGWTVEQFQHEVYMCEAIWPLLELEQ
jgi:hypothetical protein